MQIAERASIFGNACRHCSRWIKAGCPVHADERLLSADSPFMAHGAGAWPHLGSISWRPARVHPPWNDTARSAGKIAEIERKKLEECLIPVEDVWRAWALRVAEVASGLETLADRMPPLLDGKSREDMKQIIDAEVWRLRDNYRRNGKYCEFGPQIVTALKCLRILTPTNRRGCVTKGTDDGTLE